MGGDRDCLHSWVRSNEELVGHLNARPPKGLCPPPLISRCQTTPFEPSDGRSGGRGYTLTHTGAKDRDFRTLTPKSLINSGFWRLGSFSSTEAFGVRTHFAATRTATKNVRVTK